MLCRFLEGMVVGGRRILAAGVVVVVVVAVVGVAGDGTLAGVEAAVLTGAVEVEEAAVVAAGVVAVVVVATGVEIGAEVVKVQKLRSELVL